MSHILRKPVFCICENKGADLLSSHNPADQCLCFRYIDSTIPLLPTSSQLPGMCRTSDRSKTPQTGFLMMWLKCFMQLTKQFHPRVIACLVMCLLSSMYTVLRFNPQFWQHLLGFFLVDVQINQRQKIDN